MPAGKLQLVVQGTKQKKPMKSTQKAAVTVLQNAVRRKQRGKKTTITKLNNKVKRLALTQRGSIQYSRQFLQFAAIDPPQQPAPYYYNPAQPSAIRPICFLHQAISVNSRAYTLRYTRPLVIGNPPTLPSTEAGTWLKQPYPLSTASYNLAPAEVDKFDQLQFWDQNNGVSNDYTHFSTKYQMQIRATECRGYVDVFLVHPKKAYLRSDQKDYSLPLGLAGFTNMTLAADHMYSIGKDYSCKRIRRKYFNTTRPPGGAASTANYLQTNPDFDMEFTIKNRKSRRHIKAPEIANGAVLDTTDIPNHQQDWIIISTTLSNEHVTVANNLNFKIFRTPVWRDREGAST